MANLNLYTIDVLRSDGTTHFTAQALLTDDEKAKIAAWLTSISANHIGATSGTITLNSGVPLNYDHLVTTLEKQIPMDGKPQAQPKLRA